MELRSAIGIVGIEFGVAGIGYIRHAVMEGLVSSC